MISYPNAAAALVGWKWPHIEPEKWACRLTGRLIIVPEFLDTLEALRGELGVPFIITSGYRSPEHNLAVSDTGADGPHTTGLAVDLSIRGGDALRLISAALRRGITGVGVQQKGEGRFIHLDMLPPSPTRPGIWSY